MQVYPLSLYAERGLVTEVGGVSMSSKRKRGGQPSNRNAVRHGFYSANLTPREIRELFRLLERRDIDRDVAVIHIKLNHALRIAPGNRRLLLEASRLLAKQYALAYQVVGSEKTILKKVLRRVFERIGDALQNQMKLNPQNSLEKNKKRIKLDPEKQSKEQKTNRS
jgi:hypothetical protein